MTFARFKDLSFEKKVNWYEKIDTFYYFLKKKIKRT